MKAHVRELGRRIAEKRRTAELTQEQLAERARVNVKTIQGVEQGRSEPELRTIRKIARALGTTLDALEGGAKPNVRSTDALLARIHEDVRKVSPPLLEHIAAIVRALARGSKS